MVEKRNIFLIGPAGAGKSTVGRQLAQQLDMSFFDSDQEIEHRTGADISWIFDVEGENGFRNREKKVIDELTRKRGIVLATGGGSIKLYENRNSLSSRGTVIYLRTTIERQLIRTQYDKKRPVLKIGTTLREMLEILAKERNPLYSEIADFIIDTDLQNSRTITDQIVSILKR